jgi:5-methyltetrahydropteroyltriglutamate--homocysteine methyltransferase
MPLASCSSEMLSGSTRSILRTVSGTPSRVVPGRMLSPIRVPVATRGTLIPSSAVLTTVIGSYPQPDWLIDREKLRGSLPPRVRARELWRVPEPHLAQAQDDATALAIADQERAGVDIVTDGEIRRESYSNRFATALEGFDIDNPAMVPGRAGGTNAVPRVVGKVRRTRPVEVDDLRFLRSHTDRTIKITLPGPFTMSQQASNEFYTEEAELAMDLAVAVSEEVRDLFEAGADIVQLDEPWLQSRADKAREFALPAIDRALADAAGTTALHTCFGYAHVVHDRPSGYPFLAELAGCAADILAIEAAQPKLDPQLLEPIAGKTVVVGVLDLDDDAAIETPDEVARRIEAALTVIPEERLQVGPDCGMKYLPRDVAFGKLRALVEGARLATG